MTSDSQLDVSSANPTPEPETGGQMTFFEHLIELRKRIIHSLVATGIGAGIGWVVAPRFVAFITKPITEALANAKVAQQHLIYTNPTGYLSLLISLSIYLGIVMASPYILYQIWLFVAPALYKHERSAITGFLFSTVFLFLAGIAFGYFVMLPHLLEFLIGMGQKGPVEPFISVNDYFDMILMVLLGLGLVFEMPILIFFLTLFGIVTPKFLVQNSKYAILAITIIAAVITPTPDALTMLIFMAPMVGLYFVGVGVSWIVVARRERRLAAETRG
jgi:sec-independent protein translocase protein TatC